MIPSEAEEQAVVVQYCILKKLPHFHVPNSTYTTSWKQKAHNKAMGVSAGVPDLFIIAGGRLIAIEMKRLKGSTTSPHQKEWITELNNALVPTIIAKGSKEAIAFIESQKYWNKIK